MQPEISTAQIFGVERAILVDTPYCTPEEFARRTGQTVQAIRSQIDRGELPTIQRSQKRRSRRLVNLAQILRAALEVEEGVIHD